MDETHPHLQHLSGTPKHAVGDELGSFLRSLGYRLTPQRRLIMNIIESAGGHLTAQEIYQRVTEEAQDIDQATVYRTTEFFHKVGLIYSSQLNGQTVYELASQVPHHHLVCSKCGLIQHLTDHHFQHLIQHLWEEHQFRAEIEHLTIPGLCSHCLDED